MTFLSLRQVATLLLACVATVAAHAGDTSSDTRTEPKSAPSSKPKPDSVDFLKYSTVGVWAGAPLGLSARLGLALPMDRDWSLTAGAEAGLKGNKFFVGSRYLYAGHGVAWGAIDLAYWKLRANPVLAESHTDYYGVEAQLLIFRLGVMVPTSSSRSDAVKVSLGVGLSF